MSEEVTIGDCRLILGDCREVLPTLPVSPTTGMVNSSESAVPESTSARMRIVPDTSRLVCTRAKASPGGISELTSSTRSSGISLIVFSKVKSVFHTRTTR